MTASPTMPSDLLARVKTAVPLAGGLTLLLIYLPPFALGLLVSASALLGVWEYSRMLSGTARPVPFAALVGAVVLMSTGTLFAGRDGLTAALFACLLLWIGWSLLSQPVKSLEAMAGFGVGVLGLLWIVWSLQHFTLIASRQSGVAELFFVLLVVSFSDIFAYFGGKQFGRTPLAPTVSPKKTWEGSGCGLAGAGLVGLLCAGAFMSIAWHEALFLAVVTAAVGQVGDLVESKMKRLCAVKDSGSLFPGHGGLLDRADGHLLAAPAFYYLTFWL